MGRYATVGELKSHARIEDAIDDNELTLALNAAENAVDNYCRRGANGQPRPFTDINTADDTAKTSRIYDPSIETPVSHTVSLPRSTPLYIDDAAKIDSIETRTTPTGTWTVVSADDWESRPLNVDDRPYTHVMFHKRLSVHRFRVTAWFGWPTIPPEVKQATVMQAARFAQRRNASFGIATLSEMDGTGMRLLARLDADVELLLTDLRRDAVLVG